MSDIYRPYDQERGEKVRQSDPYAHAITVIDENHRMIHDGFYYEVWREDTTLADAAIINILLDVPAATFPHLQDVTLEADGGPVILEVWEGTTTSADGSALIVNNKNRNSSNTPNTDVTLTPTITDDGTQIKRASILAAGSTVVFSQSKAGEWVLQPSTKYLVRITNSSGGTRNINVSIGFYEIDYDDNLRVTN